MGTRWFWRSGANRRLEESDDLAVAAAEADAARSVDDLAAARRHARSAARHVGTPRGGHGALDLLGRAPVGAVTVKHGNLPTDRDAAVGSWCSISGENGDDLVRGMVEVPTSFCAPLYGRRSARNRALKPVRCAQRDIGPAAVVGVLGEDGGRG
jgi:hypothetical protein